MIKEIWKRGRTGRFGEETNSQYIAMAIAEHLSEKSAEVFAVTVKDGYHSVVIVCDEHSIYPTEYIEKYKQRADDYASGMQQRMPWSIL